MAFRNQHLSSWLRVLVLFALCEVSGTGAYNGQRGRLWPLGLACLCWGRLLDRWRLWLVGFNRVHFLCLGLLFWC